MTTETRTTSLYIRVKTWVRDSHGLFDYESQSVTSKAFECRCTGTVTLIGDGAKFNVEGQKIQREASQEQELIKVERLGSDFILRPGNAEDVWHVVKRMPGPQPSCPMVKEQVIKLGRVQYRVRDLQDGAQELVGSGSDTATSDEELEASDVPEEREERVCRVCYEQQRDGVNPLLSHCKCDGSVKYIHLECLKQWLKSKVTMSNTENSVTYHWKALECDICRTELPLTLKYKGTKLDLFDFAKPESPYLVLEAIVSERHKAVHVINLNSGRQSVKLGRGHDSDVRINDISVSRCHAIIGLKAGGFVLEDNNSKFGTLVQAKGEMRLEPGTSTTLQVGRSLLDLEVRSSTSKLGKHDLRVIPETDTLSKA